MHALFSSCLQRTDWEETVDFYPTGKGKKSNQSGIGASWPPDWEVQHGAPEFCGCFVKVQNNGKVDGTISGA